MTGLASPYFSLFHYRMAKRNKEMACPGNAIKNINLKQTKIFNENLPCIPIPSYTILSLMFLLLGKPYHLPFP